MPQLQTREPKLSGEAARLNIIFKDYNGTQEDFAKEFGLGQSMINQMLKGHKKISVKVAKTICFKWGYSAAWFFTGVGPKKEKTDKESKLITEISMLRVENDILVKKVQMLDARMQAYEKEINEVKKLLSSRV
ncbi:helix-turn-helix domain-containing protein [Mucilaginibacter gossypii]|uniref:helix-turn-helix domain-containing protein n=1 Tax=Mucilaginibacter gossypii TaxID=551996 RepID=UPI000DCB41F0|nr:MULTISPECIES: helix-turn-helix domain-containing protein [Mucilaginibacter]QTE37527.1 helix-turn-helix domain-containing protein [Mucilaginibacter gossypii]RAV52353.1 hypothetical protein DIU36_24775 [Mucilaginibacter rubeus]